MVDAGMLSSPWDSFLPQHLQQDLRCQELLGEKGDREIESHLWPVRGLTNVNISGWQGPDSKPLQLFS